MVFVYALQKLAILDFLVYYHNHCCLYDDDDTNFLVFQDSSPTKYLQQVYTHNKVYYDDIEDILDNLTINNLHLDVHQNYQFVLLFHC